MQELQRNEEEANIGEENIFIFCAQKIVNFLGFGEKATTNITKEKNSQGFTECKDSANVGGNIAKRAREDLEKNLKKSIISDTNFLPKKKEIKKESRKNK